MLIPLGYRITTDTELPRALLHFMYQSAKSSRVQKQEFFKTIFNFFDLEATQLKVVLGVSRLTFVGGARAPQIPRRERGGL